MRKIVFCLSFYAGMLSACSTGSIRQPSSALGMVSAQESSLLTAGNLALQYRFAPSTKKKPPRDWDGLYQKRFAASYCDKAVSDSPKIPGVKIVPGPVRDQWQDENFGFEFTNEQNLPLISAWIKNENARTFREIGCGANHRAVWDRVLATMKAQRPASIAFEDLDLGNLNGAWKARQLGADGQELISSFRGLRVLLPPSATNEKTTPNVPDWIRRLLPQEHLSRVESVQPLGVKTALVKFLGGPSVQLQALILWTDSPPAEEGYVPGMPIICRPENCGLSWSKYGVYFFGGGFSGGKQTFGFFEFNLASKKYNLVYEVDPSNADTARISAAPINPQAEGVLYRAVIENQAVELSLAKGSLKLNRTAKLRVQNSSRLSATWISKDAVWGIGLRKTNSFVWRQKNPFDASGKYEEWEPSEPAYLQSISLDGKDNPYFTGLGGGTSLVAYAYDSKSNSLKKLFDGGVGDKYRVSLHFADAPDGHKVPLLVKHRADVDPAKGTHPVLLYGYGGFNHPQAVPQLDTFSQIDEDQGYIEVRPALRGGPEISLEDERAGKFLGREKNYDDMLAAAKYVVARGWAPKGKMWLWGGSNGGLLALRTVLKNPELFSAVYVISPVTDMLRFVDIDSTGLSWATTDYGNPLTDQAVFDFWRNNGPLQMLKKGQTLPPILLRTALGDKVVSPAHSFKMLQSLRDNANGGPFLLYTGPNNWTHSPATQRDLAEEFSYRINFFETYGK